MWSYSDLAYLSFRTALLEELNGPAFEKKKKKRLEFHYRLVYLGTDECKDKQH